MKWLHTLLGILAIGTVADATISDTYVEQLKPLFYSSENQSHNIDYNDLMNQGYISYIVGSRFRYEYSSKYHRRHAENRQAFERWDKYYNAKNGQLKRVFNKRIFLESMPNRRIVSHYKMGMYPYNNVVKLSAGCTGTLLTPRHVLTVAHCVHDGKRFKNNMEMLKVEVAEWVGYRIHYIKKINVPVLWLKTQTLPEIVRGAFDYAVLQLNLPVSGRENFMPLALPTIKSLNSNLEFLGYKLGKAPVLWLSECDTDEGMVIMRENVALRKCDTSTGNSGAAVFANNHIGENKIIGIFTNTILTAGGKPSSHSTEYGAIMLLTMQKCLDICTMLHPEGEKHAVCKAVKRNNAQYLEIGSTRIMPFFG